MAKKQEIILSDYIDNLPSLSHEDLNKLIEMAAKEHEARIADASQTLNVLKGVK